MGTGRASGEKRALGAMQQAIASPLLKDVTIDGATGLLINITGGRDMTLQEVNEALTLVHDAADPEAEIIFGSLIDETVSEEIKITIIATGFVHRESKRPAAAAPVQAPLLARLPAREEVATLVPAKVGARTLTNPESKAVSPRTAVAREPALPVDDDQYDIPTFLRKQGQTEMP
jgi:cell division protein FtsZ